MCRRKQSKRHSGKYTDLRTAYITSQIHTGDTYKIASSLRAIFSSSCTSKKLSQVRMLQRRTDCCLHLLCISETFVLSACMSKKPLPYLTGQPAQYYIEYFIICMYVNNVSSHTDFQTLYICITLSLIS